MNRNIALLAVLAAITLASCGGGAQEMRITSAAQTLTVNSQISQGWVLQTSGTASAAYVNGPATPPLGTGSVEFEVGADGNSAAQARTGNFNGTLLADIDELEYSTYVQQDGSGGQAPYLLLNIDLNGDGSTDDQLFFEPVYQTGTYSGDTVPNQGAPIVGEWQTWDALVGGWWAFSDFTFGPPLVTLDSYIADNPTAALATDSRAVRIVTGFGAGAWDNFVGNADAFTIGINGDSVTYNFEGAVFGKDDCKNGGWQSLGFKNQGECVSFFTKGGQQGQGGGNN